MVGLATVNDTRAQHDGTIRRHGPDRDGGPRDTVFFSMLDVEWPAAKARLEQRLERHERSGSAS